MKDPNAKEKSLLMCATPLQALIAEKIIELNPNNTFDLVFTKYSTDNSTKINHYFNRLKKHCCNSLLWTLSPGLNNFLYFRLKLYAIGFNQNYKELYLANIERRHFQFFITQNPHATIYTFDDGMGNINPLSKFYSDISPSILKKFIWKGLGVQDYMKDIRGKTKLHYTIYNDIPNIISNTQYIQLFRFNNSKSYNKVEKKKVRIYLGQPLFDINPKFNNDFILSQINKLNIDYYYPHPREVDIPNGNFKIIESNLICEDYILQLLDTNTDIEVEIYSFISSVLLNLVNIERLETYYIYETSLQDSFHQFYTLAEQKFRIKSIAVR